MSSTLDKIFNPKSIAIIGASNIPGKWGFIIPLNIVTGGYSGKVYPINPKEKRIIGLKAYSNLSVVEDEIDLAIITIPATGVEESIRDCAKKGIQFAVVISSNFSETGKEGAKLESEMVKTARELGVRIIGPNTMGFYSSSSDLCAMGSPFRPLKGTVGFISQSGNLGVQLMGRGSQEGLGFSCFIGSGNEADLTVVDFMDYLGNASETKVILLYLEGIDEGRRFFEVASRVSHKKPIIVLKSAKTETGARAAISHTGAIAGNKEVCESVFKQAGIIEASTSEELLDLGKAFAHFPVPKGNSVAILTLGGGWGVITAEACAQEGLILPELDKGLMDELDRILPQFWSKSNPIDMVGSLRRTTHFNAIRALAEWENVDSVIIMGVFAGVMLSLNYIIKSMRTSRWNFMRNHFSAAMSFYPSVVKGIIRASRSSGSSSTSRGGSGGFNLKEIGKWGDKHISNIILELMKEYRKPIVGVSGSQDRVVDIAKRYNLITYDTPEKSARVLAKMVRYGEFIKKSMPVSTPIKDISVDLNEVETLLRSAKGALTEYQSKILLSHYGIPITREKLAESKDEAKKFAHEIGYPVVLKAQSPDILHKTEALTVKLDIKSDDELKFSYDEILKNAKKHSQSAKIEGVLVQEMVGKGVEVIAGCSKDPQFGHVIVFGLGGIFVEVLKDTSLRLPPISKDEAIEMIKQIRGYKILEGVRGKSHSDIDAIADVIVRLSELVMDFGDKISEIDINPLVVFEKGKGAKAVDALVVVGEDYKKSTTPP